jgi:hypothetical protein
VFIVGDWLTVGVAPYVPGAFAATGIPIAGIDGKVGRHTNEGTSILAGDRERHRRTQHDDRRRARDERRRSASAFASEVDQFLAVAGSRKVVWVNIAFDDGRDTQAVALNGQLAARSGRLQVADWHSFVAGLGDWWAGDGTHLNGTGYQVRANWLAGQILATR